MKRFEDGLVMAYVDGELDTCERAEFERQMCGDTELGEQVARLREMNAMLGAAFNEAMHGEMPPLRAFADCRRPSLWQRFSEWFTDANELRWQPVAVCVLLVAVSAGSGGYWLSANRSVDVTAVLAEVRLQEVTLNRALETQVSGTTVEWNDSATGMVGTVTPVRTFKTEQGQFCREFVERQLIQEQWQEQRGVACREGKENWQVRARYYL